MEINGLYATVHLPDAPQGEGIHALPPYAIQTTYKVDDYPACPNNWMHGSSKAASYFLPVRTGAHLWLDFNQNWNHTHYVAIVLSVQGINPITGLPTKSLRLEQYRSKCIIHGTDFGADRFCQQCNDNVPGVYDGTPVTVMPSKWPPQNYMTTAKHLSGQLWIDGWQAEDETIRGFLITSETMRGIAQQIIGEDRVFAIGIAFYLSKEPKPVVQSVLRSRGGISGQSVGGMVHEYMKMKYGSATLHSASYTMSSDTHPCDCSMSFNNASSDMSAEAAVRSIIDEVQEVETEKLEIGAGAKIRQRICELDPNDPSFYKDEPEGLIYINYCTKADFDKIMAAGKTDRSKGGEGFLSGLTKGN